MTPTRIHLLGAAGGQGTTTCAVSLAAVGARVGWHTTVVTDDMPAAAVLAGVPQPTYDDETLLVPPGAAQPCVRITTSDQHAGPQDLVVYDHATSYESVLQAPFGPCYAVLRGPGFPALHRLVRYGIRFDGIVLLAEDGRALDEQDVTEASGFPIVARIPVDVSTARLIDAGLLLPRLSVDSSRQFARALRAMLPVDDDRRSA